MSEGKKSTGRPCAICTHKAVDEINGLIRQRAGFRNISEIHGMSIASVSRHTSDHLRIDLQAIQMEKRMDSAVNIELENREQLDAAKEVRDAAREYALSKPEGEVVSAFRAAFDGIKTVNVTLDTQAKLKGEYQQDKKNESDTLKEMLDKVLKERESMPGLTNHEVLTDIAKKGEFEWDPDTMGWLEYKMDRVTELKGGM